MRHFQDEVPKHYLDSVKQQIKRIARLVEDDADGKAEAAAEEIGDDVILQQIDAEEAAEIEIERTTVPEEAIVEPFIIQKLKMLRKICLHGGATSFMHSWMPMRSREVFC